MKIQSIENQSKAKRYLVLIKDAKSQSVKKVERELNVNLVSSEELNSKNRAFQVMNDDTGIFYKNLNVAVVDKVPTSVLNTSVKNSESPVVFWEEEREFNTMVGEFDIIDQLKNDVLNIEQQINRLEEVLLEKRKNESDNWNNVTWGIDAISLRNAKQTGKGVKVCILDTGLYAAHPDFANRTISGKSFIQSEAWDYDGNGHGTHCAGTAVGFLSDDGKRYGVANEAEIYIGKVLSDNGSGSTSSIIDGIDWALEKKCKVISMSLGAPTRVGENPSLIFENAGEKALEKGCLIIAAAGNDSKRPSTLRPVSCPANSRSIISIAAVDKTLSIARSSNAGLNSGTGGRIDLAAPGVDIFSTFSKNAPGNNLYKRLNGTSAATPHITGIAALLWEAYPNATPSEIWLKLEKNAKVLSDLHTRDIGNGLVQAHINTAQ